MCSTGKEDEADDDHAKPEQHEHNKPKDQEEELVETDLTTQKGEP